MTEIIETHIFSRKTKEKFTFVLKKFIKISDTYCIKSITILLSPNIDSKIIVYSSSYDGEPGFAFNEKNSFLKLGR